LNLAFRKHPLHNRAGKAEAKYVAAIQLTHFYSIPSFDSNAKAWPDRLHGLHLHVSLARLHRQFETSLARFGPVVGA